MAWSGGFIRLINLLMPRRLLDSHMANQLHLLNETHLVWIFGGHWYMPYTKSMPVYFTIQFRLVQVFDI